jgi:exopolysaccharide biosynthesis WecB/TagA/CpsF family protein
MKMSFDFDKTAAEPIGFGARVLFDRGRFQLVAGDALAVNDTTELFGLPLVNQTLEATAAAIVDRAALRQSSNIQFINAHCINTLKTDEAYARALAQADALLPDGSGLTLAAKLAGRSIQANLNGTDLFPVLCAEAAARGVSIFMLGGKPGIAQAAASLMRASTPGLRIAGTFNGYFKPDEEDEIIDMINASGAAIVLVGFGVPRQEIWIAKNKARLDASVVIGVGGLFDYYSGRIPRAPMMMRQTGTEWIWRFLQEPRRLARRYTVGNLAFLARALANAWIARGHAERYAKASKRTLDLAIALTALVLLGPLFAAICLFITLEDRGPIFFKQTRIGRNGKPFRMWKFRSMCIDAEARRAALLTQSERDGVCFKMKRDPRITQVGSWLRRMSLDELPQVLNVVRGEMSIVGPRPALPQEVLTYNDRARERLHGLPGLTCTWQVSGRANIPFEQQVELDIDYVRRPSVGRDLWLILRTVPAVLTGRGAY